MMAGVVWSPLWLGTFFTKKLKESYLFVMKRNEPLMTAQLENKIKPKKGSLKRPFFITAEGTVQLPDPDLS